MVKYHIERLVRVMSNTVVAGKYTLQNKDIPLIKFDLLRETVTVNGIQAYDYAGV